jgi:hypothetical protein
MRSSETGRRGERGATLVMVALMVFMLLGMAALSIDYGMVKATKAEAQRAVDAAALAGASSFLEPDPMNDDSNVAVMRADSLAAAHEVRQVLIDTTAEIDIDVILAEEKVRVTFTRTGMPVWFANIFGINSVGIKAVAVARAVAASNAACVMPVAIPDLWKNVNVDPSKPNDPPEELVPDGLWNFVDKPGGNTGILDSRERELWEFDLGEDIYDQELYGYNSPYRNSPDSGGTIPRTGNPFLDKTGDYGRQITLMTLAPQDGTTSSNYYTWGYTTNEANSANEVAARITSRNCQIATVGGEGYEVPAGDGAEVGPISNAWNERIAYDAPARWDDYSNTAVDALGGTNWINTTPRVVIVALYSPEGEMTGPSDNKLVFNNFARVFLDPRPPGCAAVCKDPITARFLGFVTSPGGGPGVTGTLIRKLQLVE